MAEEKEAKPEKKESKIAQVIEVPIQTAPAYQLEDGKVIDDKELLVLIYNKVCKIERSVA